MSDTPHCPECHSEHSYPDRDMLVCPMCAHEWNPSNNASQNRDLENIIKDSNGNILKDGDSVTVIKELKINGSSSVVKAGTKVKGIRLIDGNDGHDISCKIKGIGSMQLKSQFVKRSK